MGAMASPLLGPAGNAEFLLHLRAHGASGSGSSAERPVAEVLAAAIGEAPDSADPVDSARPLSPPDRDSAAPESRS